MSWIYKGVEFTEDNIPEGSIGFIYHMSVILNGNTYAYIGKKNFFANIKKKLSKKALALVTDKRLKKYTREQKPNFMNYYSSNQQLKEAHKAGCKIKREILVICYSATELTYQEVKHQFKYEVLEKEEYLNANILGRFYKTK
jgi:thiazole synthase ThiGH ThiG subunit